MSDHFLYWDLHACLELYGKGCGMAWFPIASEVTNVRSGIFAVHAGMTLIIAHCDRLPAAQLVTQCPV